MEKQKKKRKKPVSSRRKGTRKKGRKKQGRRFFLLCLLFLCLLFACLQPEGTSEQPFYQSFIDEAARHVPDGNRQALTDAAARLADSILGQGETPAESTEASGQPAISDSQDGTSYLRVDFLDVGQGLSVLAEADGQYLLYDGGDRTASSFVVAYLKQRGVEYLDYLVASHYDSDHINGLVGALHTTEAGTILGPDYEADSRVYRSLVSQVSEQGKTIETPKPGSRYPLGSGYFEVLAPLSDSYEDANNSSIVIRIVQGDTSFLLTGDAEAESEREMLAAWPDLKSDVLCVGHHGSASSTGSEFLSAVNPSAAVISCGKENSYGHPTADVLNRLSAQGCQIWRTDEDGTITAVSNGRSVTWSTERTNAGS